jgi:hypothetical protein
MARIPACAARRCHPEFFVSPAFSLQRLPLPLFSERRRPIAWLAANESLLPRVHRRCTEALFDAQELVVFLHALATTGGVILLAQLGESYQESGSHDRALFLNDPEMSEYRNLN